jgi:anti-sigma B factor antagonist
LKWRFELSARERLGKRLNQLEAQTNQRRSNVALKLNVREADGVAVLGLDGRVVLGDESNALREQVKKMLAAGKKKIVLDMSNVSYIDSAGLGTLVAAHHSARTQGASLKLSNLGKKFQEILQVTKLLTVFDVYPSEAAAISSFGH